MFGKRRLAVAAAAVVLMAALGACGTGAEGAAGGKGSQGSNELQGSESRADSVAGLRDSVRHLPAKTVRATRPHTVSTCTSTTRRVKHTQRSGTGTRAKTRTWYTTERHQDCRKIRRGTETYQRVIRTEKWCVSLDDVDGKAAKDDVWYRVSRTTYDDAVGLDRHARFEFVPTGSGC
ncbi:hypothetical protein AB5J56_42670 [Streptomyces sp. R21]|uniref:Lipoprotein n=1 Tax=Streptomyces sp. R21 TaxID=3238627 RepID=A0AB39PK95_9ACTN